MEGAPASSRIVKSQNCMMEISKYLPQKQLFEWQLLNTHFYNKIVPEVMRNRQLNPIIQQKVHIFLKEKAVYGISITDKQDIKYVDFEEDNWRHDSQYTINEKCTLLFDMSKFSEVAEDEEILPHYIIQLNATKFIVYPLKEAVFLGKGLVIEIGQNAEPKVVKELKAPPEQLLRPGICP